MKINFWELIIILLLVCPPIMVIGCILLSMAGLLDFDTDETTDR
jgi:hypothetical protein